MPKLVIWVTAAAALLAAVIGYSQWQWGGGGTGRENWNVRGGDPRQGRQSILGYGCAACHVVGGIGRATGRVGPKLEGIHEQIYVGGVIANTPENMVAWIMFPRNWSPRTAMPDLEVTEQDARDMAAYLYGNQ